MRTLFLAASVLLLSACAAPQQQPIHISATPVLSSAAPVSNTTMQLTSSDVRTSKYVALVDNGHADIISVDTDKDLNATIKQALEKQFSSQGFISKTHSNNLVNIELQEFLVNVKHSAMQKEMHSKVTIKITAETPKGKLDKTFYGVANRTGMMSASSGDIETVLNDTLNLVLKKIATDPELTKYMKERF